jgi:hypothetical protein
MGLMPPARWLESRIFSQVKFGPAFRKGPYMALYKNGNWLTQSDDAAFDTIYTPRRLPETTARLEDASAMPRRGHEKAAAGLSISTVKSNVLGRDRTTFDLLYLGWIDGLNSSRLP